MVTNSKIRLLPKQIEFIQSPAIYTGYVGGFGAGKTHSAVVKSILKKLQMPYVDFAYYLPTYSLIKTIAIPRIEAIATQLGLTTKVNKVDYYVELFNGGVSIGKIFLRSLQMPEYIVGYEVAYSVIDEADMLDTKKMQNVFDKINARNRAKIINDINRIDLVGTPEGYKFMYDFFEQKKSNDKLLIQAPTYNNPFLPKDYVKRLLKQFDEKKIQAYLLGKFVALDTGNVFYTFNQTKSKTNKTINDTDTLHIGMDFNIGKMTAVSYILENNKFYAVDEIVNAFDTYQMIEIIKSRYSGKNIIIYPDASASARKTNAGVTDYDMLKSAFYVKKLKKNPLIKDRINIANNVIRLDRLFVNPEKCPVFIDALQTLTYDSNGMPDKSSGKDHIIDAGTYPIYTIEKANNLIY